MVLIFLTLSAVAAVVIIAVVIWQNGKIQQAEISLRQAEINRNKEELVAREIQYRAEALKYRAQLYNSEGKSKYE